LQFLQVLQLLPSAFPKAELGPDCLNGTRCSLIWKVVPWPVTFIAELNRLEYQADVRQLPDWV
jgi:hypothetical protein